MAMTISTMANMNYSVFKFASKNGTSLFGTPNASVGKTNSIQNLWSSYESSQQESGLTAANVYGVQKNVSDVLSSYDSAKKEFHTELNSAMSDLSDASSKLKQTNFDVGGESALSKVTTTSTDSKGKTTTTTTLNMSDALKTAVKNVEDFVNKYNDAAKLFKDKGSFSKRMDYMAKEFSDTTYRANSYNAIGIKVDKDGALSVDEEKLATAITKSPSKVSNILGKNGLAGKADAHMQTVNSQKDKLFPEVHSLFGSEMKQAQAYTGNSVLSMNRYVTVGRLFDMGF